jgi:hypothetical protein
MGYRYGISIREIGYQPKNRYTEIGLFLNRCGPNPRFMYDQNDDVNSMFYDRIDVDAMGMVGYSMGGGQGLILVHFSAQRKRFSWGR